MEQKKQVYRGIHKFGRVAVIIATCGLSFLAEWYGKLIERQAVIDAKYEEELEKKKKEDAETLATAKAIMAQAVAAQQNNQELNFPNTEAQK